MEVNRGRDFSMGCRRRHETNISTGGEAASEKLYVLICDSRVRSPSGTREFLYVIFFFYIFHHLCVPRLFRCYALNSKVIFTRSLTFICPTYFISRHTSPVTPLMSFLCHSPCISVHFPLFPPPTKCDNIVHLRTL